MGNVSTYVGLYYPFIHFKDDNWLKLAALYWDKMGRIVPAGYPTRNDSNTVRRLIDAGFVENCPPEEFRYEPAIRFLELIRLHGPALRKRYGVADRGSWPIDPQKVMQYPENAEPQLAYVFVEKLADDFRDALEEEQLAVRGRGDDTRWLGMHPRLLLAYMAVLAEATARHRGFHPTTDETLDHVAVGGWTVERLAKGLLGDTTAPPSLDEVERLLASIAIKSVAPKDLSAVDVQKIIAIRHKYPAELAAFQEAVHQLAPSLSEQLQHVANRDDVVMHLEIAWSKLKPHLDGLRDQARSVNVEMVQNVMGMSLEAPVAVQSLGAVLAVTPEPVTAALGGVALGAARVLSDRSKMGKDGDQHPAAYLLRVEQGLAPSSVVSWIREKVDRFMV